MSEYDRIRYSTFKQLGLCVKCGKKEKGTTLLCDECYERRPKQRREYQQHRYYSRKAQGLCVDCGSPTLNGKACCETCYGKRKIPRQIVLTHYGTKCTCCGETIEQFLDLDHINNDGASHRKQIGNRTGRAFYQWVIDNDFPDYLQVLCINCNLGKHRNNGICPHKEQQARERGEWVD